MTLHEIQDTLRKHKNELRQRFGVKSIGIFGSYARAHQNEASDIDLLVAFEKPIGLDFVELALYLESVLGKKVDLVSVGALARKPKIHALVEKEVIYA